MVGSFVRAGRRAMDWSARRARRSPAGAGANQFLHGNSTPTPSGGGNWGSGVPFFPEYYSRRGATKI